MFSVCNAPLQRLYKGLHKTLVDYATWERAQWFRAARKAAHPLGLLWARGYVFEKGRDIRVPLPNTHPRPKEEFLVDPAESSRLVQICELYLKQNSILKVPRQIHTRPKNVTTVLHEQHYKILGPIWNEAHSVYELAAKHSLHDGKCVEEAPLLGQSHRRTIYLRNPPSSTQPNPRRAKSSRSYPTVIIQ